MSPKSKIIYLLTTIFFFILCNWYFSGVIINSGDSVAENPIFDITFIQNQGAAFNIFDGYKIFLITFALAAIFAILFYAIKHIAKLSTMGLFFASLLISGIFNNMAERIIYGYVRDFIKLNFIDFPIFNISDIFINIGVLGIVFVILKRNYLKNM